MAVLVVVRPRNVFRGSTVIPGFETPNLSRTTPKLEIRAINFHAKGSQ